MWRALPEDIRGEIRKRLLQDANLLLVQLIALATRQEDTESLQKVVAAIGDMLVVHKATDRTRAVLHGLRDCWYQHFERTCLDRPEWYVPASLAFAELDAVFARVLAPLGNVGCVRHVVAARDGVRGVVRSTWAP